MNFEDAFRNVIGEEGGYVDHPSDPGGETKYGISKRSYPNVDIANLTLEQARAIYKRDYWDRLRGDELPYPLAEFLFDFAVNSGVGAATKALQRALGVLPDGVIGPVTLAAARAKDPRHVMRLVFVDRALLFAGNANLDTFGHGWFARLFDVTFRFAKEV